MLTIDECKRMLSNAAKERRELKSMVDERDELIRDLHAQLLNAYDPKEIEDFGQRMEQMGIDV